MPTPVSAPRLRVIEGFTADVITPFPAAETARVWGWIKSHTNISETDESPHSREELGEQLAVVLPYVASYGIIDRDNRTKLPHPAPLVGIVLIEPRSAYDADMYWATTRAAMREHLTPEAVLAVVSDVFHNTPELARISVSLHQSNQPAASLAKRLGFVREGRKEDAIVVRGVPVAQRLYGLTRRKWEQAWSTTSSTESPPSSSGSMSSDTPALVQESQD